MNPKPLRHVDLISESRRLEALYRDVDDPAAVAVICHPHPLEGGTLHNKVVFRAAKGFERANVATLRFNFRGAGTSQGTHDFGIGEQRDVEAAIKWLAAKHPGKKIFAGGFSFGSWVASRVACDDERVSAIFLIGAPVAKYDLRYLRHCPKPLLFVHGSNDAFGEVGQLTAITEQCPDAETIIVSGADHFFKDQIEVVEQTLYEWVEARLSQSG